MQVAMAAARAAVAVPRRVRFYYDFISHNAFLAWYKLQQLSTTSLAPPSGGLTVMPFVVEPVPTLFAGFLKRYDQVGPAEVPPKNWWMLKNVVRKAVDMGLPPMQPPAVHPFNPLLSLRVARHDWGSTQATASVVTSLFDAVWLESRNVMEPEVVAECVTAGLSRAGQSRRVSAAQVAAIARDPHAKDRLTRDTDQAIEHGAFGVPTMEVMPTCSEAPFPRSTDLCQDSELPGEVFFGFDDIGYMLRYLNGEDPIADIDLDRWRGITSRHRKR